jgi:hypothetical protein
MFLSFKIHSVLLYSSRCMRQCDSARKSYLIQLLVSHTFESTPHALRYVTLRRRTYPGPRRPGIRYATARYDPGRLYAFVCFKSPAGAGTAPRRAAARNVALGRAARFSPFARAVDGPLRRWALTLFAANTSP